MYNQLARVFTTGFLLMFWFQNVNATEVKDVQRIDFYINLVENIEEINETQFSLWLDSKEIDVLALDLTIEYNQESMQFLGVEYQPLSSDFSIAENANLPNEIRIALASSNPYNGSNILLKLRFSGKHKNGVKIGYEKINDILYERVYLEGIKLNQHFLSFEAIGENQQIEVEFIPNDASYKGLIWTSLDEAVAKVENGLITSTGFGRTSISVTSIDGQFTQNIDVLVKQKIDYTEEMLPEETDSASIDNESSQHDNSPIEKYIPPSKIDVNEVVSIIESNSIISLIKSHTYEVNVLLEDGNQVLKREVLSLLQETGKKMYLSYIDNMHKLYEWVIFGTGVYNDDPIDLSVNLRKNSEMILINGKESVPNLEIEFTHNGAFPQGSVIHLYVGDIWKDNTQLVVEYSKRDEHSDINKNIMVYEGYVNLVVQDSQSIILEQKLEAKNDDNKTTVSNGNDENKSELNLIVITFVVIISSGLAYLMYKKSSSSI